jgi:hypothetical protein
MVDKNMRIGAAKANRKEDADEKSFHYFS